MESKAAEYFRVFFEATQTILSSASLRDILKVLVKRAVGALEVKAGSLLLVDEKTHRLELAASHLLSQQFLEKGALSAAESIPEVLEGKVAVIADVARDSRVQYPEALGREGIRAILSVPVVARGRVIGALRLYAKQSRPFTDEEIEFASALAEMGGLAIANARVYEEQGVRLSSLLRDVGVDLPAKAPVGKQRFRSFALQRIDPAVSLEHFRILHQVTRAILSTLDSREVMELIIAKVRSVSAVQGCSLRLIDETTGELALVAASGLSEPFLAKGPVHLDRSIREALEGSPVLVADVGSDPRVEYPEALAREGIASLLTLPILVRERVIGVLRLYAAAPRDYHREEVAFLAALAEIAGIAIMNAKLYERTRYDLSFWEATLEYLDAGSDRGGAAP